eukprot:Rhum_TRINITY_DN15105_c1_g1::Rhum_TRINITY_DN15105_c1_g1_i6::g.138345::m.138345
MDAAEAAEEARRAQLPSSVEPPALFALRFQAEKARAAAQTRKAFAQPSVPAWRRHAPPPQAPPPPDVQRHAPPPPMVPPPPQDDLDESTSSDWSELGSMSTLPDSLSDFSDHEVNSQCSDDPAPRHRWPNEVLVELEAQVERRVAREALLAAEEAEELDDDDTTRLLDDIGSRRLRGPELQTLLAEQKAAAEAMQDEWRATVWQEWALYEATAPLPVPRPDRIPDSDEEKTNCE